jgi:glutamyl-tRNA synthetase
MKITHVIRGEDHINNTPRQINIFKALNASPPIFAHIPMILGSDGKRLSKRHGAVSVMQYHEEGYLPEALINYLVRLGWSHGDQEIFTQDEMINYFSLDHISHSPATFNPEKLLWLNHHYIKETAPALLATKLAWHLTKMGIDSSQGPSLEEVVIALRERSKTLVDMANNCRFLFEDTLIYDENAIKKELQQDNTLDIYQLLYSKLSDLGLWDKESIHQQIQAVTQELGLKMPKVAQPLRIAVTGGTSSPSIDITLQLLGKSKTLQRIEAIMAKLKA